MASSIAPCFLTATEAVKLMRSGELTVEEMAKSTLERIQQRDDDVKAWAYLNPDLILKSAKALDAIPPHMRGPLHGIPIAVKDVIYTIDMPTEHGSPVYKGDFPKVDAGPVMTLRAAGALIFGKTITTEFAASGRGFPTKNPYNPSRTPGGSSSGSGAAVGDFQCTLGLGTQTIGSTLRPGSYNNIFAMKPTWTSISREGLKLLSISLDTLGLYGRSVEDLELMCKVFEMADDETPIVKPISQMKIAYCKTPVWTEDRVQPSLAKVWEEGIELLKEAGVEMIELELPKDFDNVLDASKVVMNSEARSAFLGDYKRCPTAFHDDFAHRVENKRNHISRKQQLEAYDYLAKLKPEFDAIASLYDAILTPTVPGEAQLGIDRTGDASFCGMWTGLQCPSVNIPGFSGDTGMPVGLTLVSGRYTDMKLLTVAEEVAKVFKASKSGKNIIRLPGVPHSLYP